MSPTGRTSTTNACDVSVTLDAFLVAHGSALILPLAVLKGPVVTTLTGFLTAQGYFVWYWALCLLVCGDVTGDVIAYWIGRSSGTKLAGLARHAGLARLLTPKLQRGLTENAARMLCIGKWTHSIGWLVLIGAGMLRVPLPGFILVNLLATLPKSALLFGLGYYVGQDYPLFERHSGAALLMLGAAGIVLVVLTLRRGERIGGGTMRIAPHGNRPHGNRPMRVAR